MNPGMSPPGMMPPPDPSMMALQQAPPSVPSEPDLSDPMQLVLALKALAGESQALAPIYPRGFVKPPKPVMETIIADARRLYDANSMWRMLIREVQRWTRQEVTGSFDEDIEEREQWFQESYPGTALVDMRNLAISKLTTLSRSYLKRARTEHKSDAEKVESACHHIRREFEYWHMIEGNRPLTGDEAAEMTDVGMLATRLTFNDTDPDFPLCRKVVSGTEVYPIWGGTGGRLKAVYRVYQSTVQRIMETYGDLLDDKAMASLKKQYGADQIGGTVEVQVYEYWDEWWRGVFLADAAIMDVTDHQYGRVPWTIRYGGMGEPMYRRSGYGRNIRDLNYYLGETVTGLQSDRVYKAVPLIFYRIRSHSLFESLMARVVTGIKKQINPPMIRSRSDMAAEKPMIPLDTSPGAQNETMRGEEDLSPIPTSSVGADVQLVMGMLNTDQDRGGFSKAAFGAIDKSNITGVAMDTGIDTTLDSLVPIIKALEFGEAMEMELALSLIRNFGNDAKYGGSAAVTPFMIPGRRKNDDAFELDAELIDRVGTRVEATFTQIDDSKWMPLIQAGQMGVTLGVLKRSEIREKLTGEHDWESHFQEWIDESALVNATQLPEFAKAVTVPAAYDNEILAASGDPERQQMLREQKAQWMEITKPAPPAPPQMPGGPPPGPPQGPPGAPPQPQGVVSTQGVSLPDLNQAPGQNGLPVGRPMSGQNVGP